MWFDDKEIEAVLQKVVDNFLKPRFKELGMNASGEWLQNVGISVVDDSGTIDARAYSEELAKGRKPGKLPPVKQIEKWVNVKLGLSGNEAKSVAWAISKKIEKEGTSWYKKGGSDLIEVLSEPRTIQFIQEELSGILRIRIAENLVRTAHEVFG
jgi:hypothetical protein